jgi:phospholipase C
MLLGKYVGTANCQATHPVQRPPVPYGQQGNITDALWFEEGYKEVVGYLTEGRYLVFDKSGYALTNAGNNATQLSSSRTSAGYSDKRQRWVIHYSGGEQTQVFRISSALDGRWLGPKGTLLPAIEGNQAADVTITFLGNGQGYTLRYPDSTPIEVDGKGMLDLQERKAPGKGYKIWSVSYH